MKHRGHRGRSPLLYNSTLRKMCADLAAGQSVFQHLVALWRAPVRKEHLSGEARGNLHATCGVGKETLGKAHRRGTQVPARQHLFREGALAA